MGLQMSPTAVAESFALRPRTGSREESRAREEAEETGGRQFRRRSGSHQLANPDPEWRSPEGVQQPEEGNIEL